MTLLTSWFWSEGFWLPINVTWADLANTKEHTYPQVRDLYLVFPYALLIILVRLILERFLARPVGLLMGINEKRFSRAQSNPVLERVFTSTTRHPDQQRLVGLAKQLDWSTRMVERWFRHRRNQEQPSLMTKYQEASWRFTAYLIFNIYALYILHDEPWLWDTSYCWRGYPFLTLDPEVRNFYLAELAFYWSLFFSQIFDIKRKDFWVMASHHIVTIALISFSWSINIPRIGVLIMFCHDVSDIFLELAKIFNYAKKKTIADILFVIFALVFAVSRLVVYPFWILRSIIFESYVVMNVNYFPSLKMLSILCLCLQGMHLMWFSIIFKAAIKFFGAGVTKDPRSDCEESSSGEEAQEEEGKLNGGTKLNGHQSAVKNGHDHSSI